MPGANRMHSLTPLLAKVSGDTSYWASAQCGLTTTTALVADEVISQAASTGTELRLCGPKAELIVTKTATMAN